MVANTETKYNRTPVRLILTMEALSSLVNQLFQILLPWYILVSTDSVIWLGIAGFATIMPSIFSSLWGGAVIDRLGRSKTMMICEASQLILIAAIPTLIILDYAKPWLISAIIFFSAFFDEPGQMSRQSLMPSYARLAAMPLHRVTGIREALDGIMAVAGPLAGGLIIALYGTLQAWVCAVILCLAIVIIALKIFNARKPRIKPNPTTYKTAWDNLTKDPFLLKVILITLPLFILGQSWELLILPSYVHEFKHGSLFLGLLEAAFGLGAFIGAVYYAAAGKKFKFFTLSVINYSAYALSVLVLMYNLPKTLVIAATGLCGLPFGAFSAMVITIILSRAQEETRGKTLGLFAAGAAFIESVFILVIALLLKISGLFNTLLAVLIFFALLIGAAVWARRSEATPPIN